MNRKKLLDVIRNARTKKEIKDWLGLSNNGRGTKKMLKLCDDYNIPFKDEFSSNIKKNNNCSECNNLISLNKKFCNSSCSAKFNNKRRVLSTETKSKISKTIKLKYKNGYIHPNKGSKYDGISNITSSNYDKIERNYKYICKCCGDEYRLDVYPSRARKTCSRECQTKLIFENKSYHNGSRKTYKYFNKFINEEVILESSWELKVAELLDLKSIEWDRPESLTWVDNLDKSHQYYSDFYLPKYELYLDPKNLYCMKLDKVKMKYIEERYNIKYGDIKLIIKTINNLK